jgi:hypothetical protein
MEVEMDSGPEVGAVVGNVSMVETMDFAACREAVKLEMDDTMSSGGPVLTSETLSTMLVSNPGKGEWCLEFDLEAADRFGDMSADAINEQVQCTRRCLWLDLFLAVGNDLVVVVAAVRHVAQMFFALWWWTRRVYNKQK